MSQPEQQISFENQGQTLRGMLHLPEGDGTHPGVVFFHGFGGNHIEPHAIFTKAARALAREGFAVLRFDFRGSGDSDGEFGEISLQDEISDALEAVGFLESREEVDPGRLAVLGLSLGGLIAAYTASERTDLKAVVLWSAVANLGELFLASATAEQFERLTTCGYADGGGLALNPLFVEQALSLDPLRAVSAYTGPVLVIHGTRDESVPCEHADRYASVLGERAELHLVEGSDHTYSGLGWEREVIDLTSAFLRRALLSPLDSQADRR